MIAPAAFAAGRAPLPGGGSVVIPSPYRTATDYPNYSERAAPALIAYRKWRSTMSGYPDCDGMIAVGRAGDYASLDGFVATGRAGLSIQWGDADRIPGQPWDGNEKRYPLVHGEGADGAEITSQLAVHRSGFFDVYDEASSLYAVAHRGGVHVAVWIFDKHGGVKAARKAASNIAASFEG